MLLMKYQHQTAAILCVVGSVDGGGPTYGFELGKENKFIIGFTTYFKGKCLDVSLCLKTCHVCNTLNRFIWVPVNLIFKARPLVYVTLAEAA